MFSPCLFRLRFYPGPVTSRPSTPEKHPPTPDSQSQDGLTSHRGTPDQDLRTTPAQTTPSASALRSTARTAYSRCLEAAQSEQHPPSPEAADSSCETDQYAHAPVVSPGSAPPAASLPHASALQT